jgi:hypothetical protein
MGLSDTVTERLQGKSEDVADSDENAADSEGELDDADSLPLECAGAASHPESSCCRAKTTDYVLQSTHRWCVCSAEHAPTKQRMAGASIASCRRLCCAATCCMCVTTCNEALTCVVSRYCICRMNRSCGSDQENGSLGHSDRAPGCRGRDGVRREYGRFRG